MKGLLIFFFLFLNCLSSPTLAEDEHDKQLKQFQKRQLDLMQNLRKQLEADQKDMDQFFNDQFFKQADQMFKQLQDQGSPFGQMLQHFQKGFMGDFEASDSPSQWRESDQGMAFVLPYILGREDKIDLKINKNEVTLEIKRRPSQGFTRSQTYQFPIPQGTDPLGMEIVSKQKENETHILFPWKKKLEKVRPSSTDKVT